MGKKGKRGRGVERRGESDWRLAAQSARVQFCSGQKDMKKELK